MRCNQSTSQRHACSTQNTMGQYRVPNTGQYIAAFSEQLLYGTIKHAIL